MNNLTPEQINQLLSYAIGGYWSALEEKFQDWEFITEENKELLAKQLDYQEQFQNEAETREELADAPTNPRIVVDYQQTKEKNAQLERELQTFINQRKTQLRQEIELIKEVLHE